MTHLMFLMPHLMTLMVLGFLSVGEGIIIRLINLTGFLHWQLPSVNTVYRHQWQRHHCLLSPMVTSQARNSSLPFTVTHGIVNTVYRHPWQPLGYCQCLAEWPPRSKFLLWGFSSAHFRLVRRWFSGERDFSSGFESPGES